MYCDFTCCDWRVACWWLSQSGAWQVIGLAVASTLEELFITSQLPHSIRVYLVSKV